MDNTTNFTLTVAQNSPLMRLDIFIAQQRPEFSRTFCQKLISDNKITVNGTLTSRASTPVKEHDIVHVTIPPAPALGTPKAFTGDLGVQLLHTTEDFLIISKPAGLVVHEPIAGSPEITLVDWLLARFQTMAEVGSPDRPGIVHRLDKDTSGLMIVARTSQAHMQLSDMFKNRQMHKTYVAVVKGIPTATGTINLPIDRHPTVRNKMTHARTGRDAVTHYKLIQQFENAALLELKPVTGRTHQIRVHCAAIGHSLLGDSTYGAKSPHIARHALHALKLEFTFKGVDYSFTQEPPADFAQLVATLG
jgi:23S rRNA pseudouridine1911/1915/1917 synthase